MIRGTGTHGSSTNGNNGAAFTRGNEGTFENDMHQEHGHDLIFYNSGGGSSNYREGVTGGEFSGTHTKNAMINSTGGRSGVETRGFNASVLYIIKTQRKIKAITWKINNLTSKSADGGVINVEWQCEVIDDTHDDCFHIVKDSFNTTPNPKNPNFIEYKDLTESKVLEWVYNHIPVGDETPSSAKTRVEVFASNIVKDMVEDKTKNTKGLPWSQTK